MSRHAIVFVLASVGCLEQGFSEVSDNLGGEGPEIEVSPVLLDFGTLSQSDEPVAQTFTVRSVGAVDLTVSSLEIDGSAASSFAFVDSDLSFVLPPETERDVEVLFQPMGANDQLARVFVSSDDEDDALVAVELVGRGAVPELEINPDPLDFSESYVGCEHSDVLEFSNVGTDTLTITELEWNGGEGFTADDADWPELPVSLEPGDGFVVDVDFLPTSDIDFEGLLAVTSNEPMGVRNHETLGTGKYAGPYSDLWEIPVDPPSDIMFAIDQSCSMDDEQNRLRSNFAVFINELSDYSNDWQIIVANDDNGCNSSGILTPSTANYEGKFGSAVSTGGGNYTEALLTVAARSIEASNGGCNTGFVREDAMLHIILVSDEPEQSSYLSSQNWADLTQRVIDAKGSDSNVKISAIAGPVPGGCQGADPGTGYSEAVNATDGVFLSICDDQWASSENLELLAEASINQDTFSLSREAVVETIEVTVNGVATSDWSYDSEANAVIVGEAAVPDEGDEVEISYYGYVECD